MTLVTPPREIPQSKLRSWADRHTLAVPDLSKAPVVAKYWGRKLPELALLSIPQLFRLLLGQVKPTLAGFGKCFDAYHNWLNCHTVKDAIMDAEAKNKKADLALIHHRAHGRRLVFSLIVLASLIGLGVYAYYFHAVVLVAIGSLALTLVNLIGRRSRDKVDSAEVTPVKRPTFEGGMPLKDLTASIGAVLAECGLEVELHGVVEWSVLRKDYRIDISCYKELNEDHLRAIERGVGWKEGSARWMSTESATVKTLAVRYGNPFVDVPLAPILPPNSQCISQPVVVGVSYTDRQFSLNLAGVHVGVVMKTGGGKTAWAFNSLIAVTSACSNAALVAIDLTNGPAFPMWHDVIQKAAYTPETAEDLLNWLIEERDRRMKVLHDIARSSDPNDTASEWNVELAEKHNAPAIICYIDELPQLVPYNGTPKGSIDLVGLLQSLVQTAAKTWISFIMAAQDTGRGDFGTTIIANQISVWLAGPCSRDDANKIFTASGRAGGYNPETLHPGVRGGPINDAGCVYVKAPHYGPDMYRFYLPPAMSSIKRLAAERIAAGRPDLDAVVDAVTLPPALGALLEAMNSCDPSADRVSSAYVATWLSKQGGRWDSKSLLEDLRDECGNFAPVTRPGKLNGATVWCYWREDVDRAVAAL